MQAQYNYAYFNHWDQKDGLSNNDVNCFAQDSLGYIWIGTTQGLNRFDGSNFVPYFSGNTDFTLAGNKINDLYADNNNQLWIATEGGVCMLNLETDLVTRFPNKLSNGNEFIRSEKAFPCTDGYVYTCYEYLTPSRGGLARFSPTSGVFENLIDADFSIWDFTIDEEKGLLWAVGDVFIEYDLTTGEYIHLEENFSPEFSSESIDQLKDGSLIITTIENGVIQYFPETKQTKTTEVKGILTHFLPYQDQFLIVGNEVGLTRIDLVNGTKSSWPIKNNDVESLPKETPRALFEDRMGRLFIGHTAGFSILDPRYQLIKNRNFADQLNPTEDQRLIIFGAYINEKANTAVFSENFKQGLQVIDLENMNLIDSVKYYRNGKFKGDLIQAEDFEVIDGHSVYMLSNLGLFQLNTDNYHVECLLEFGDPRIRRRWFNFDPKSGNLAVSSGLTSNSFEIYNLINDWDTLITLPVLYEGHNYPRKPVIRGDKIWLQSYCSTGSFNLKSKKFVPITDHFTDLAEYNFPYVNRIAFLNDSIAYLSAQIFGLIELNFNTGKHTIVADELNISRFWASDIWFDSEGWVWTNTSSGLFTFDPSTNKSLLFDTSYGLKTNDWYWAKFAHERNDKVIGMRVEFLYYVDLAELKSKLYQPEIRLQKLNISGDPFDLKFKNWNYSDLKLKAGPLSLDFEFKDINPNPPKDLKYQIRLLPLDSIWIDLGYDKRGFYSNVPGGDYQLELRTNQGNRKDLLFVSNFIIPTKFASTLLFKILIALLILGIIYLIYRLRLKDFRKRLELSKTYEVKLAEMEMTALRAQMNPHFLFNSLNSINYYILKNQSEQASDYLTKFSRLMRLILNNSKAKIVTLKEELEALGLYIEMEQLRFQKGFEYELNISKSIDTKETLVPPMLIQPYVENSIWHGLMHKEDIGKLTIDIDLKETSLQITVTDNGIGRQAAMKMKSKTAVKNSSLGMNITSKRIEHMNERLEGKTFVNISDLKDSKGEPSGTRVEIKIPFYYEKN